ARWAGAGDRSRRRRELGGDPRGIWTRRAGRGPVALWSHTGAGSGPHWIAPDGAGGIRSTRGDRVLAAHGAEQRRQGWSAGISLDASRSRHTRAADPPLDA